MSLLSMPRGETVFRAFKYAIYCLLAWNLFLFFQEDFAASANTFGDTVTWRNVVEAYSATIDTAAWVVLLLLFELETAVIPDEKLKGKLTDRMLYSGKYVKGFFLPGLAGRGGLLGREGRFPRLLGRLPVAAGLRLDRAQRVPVARGEFGFGVRVKGQSGALCPFTLTPKVRLSCRHDSQLSDH
jgi:hypothetical protein